MRLNHSSHTSKTGTREGFRHLTTTLEASYAIFYITLANLGAASRIRTETKSLEGSYANR